MRSDVSIKNIKYSVFSQFLVFIISFITRTIFINTLGADYLGLNGLLSNVITVISLADLGIGTVLIYSMYEPLAQNDSEKLKALIHFYKKVYLTIALVIFLLGLAIMPFLNVFIKESINVGNIQIIFLLFLINTTVSYLCVYKISIINADQKGYIVVVVQQIFNLVANIIMIIILLLVKNYYLYLFIQIIFSVSSNIYLSKKAERLYPFICEKQYEELSKKEILKLKKDIFAIFFHRIGGVVVSGTDNILISSLVSIKDVGIYSNYLLIINTVKRIVVQFFSSISATVGNLLIEEDKNYTYNIFNKVFFANFWIYGFCSIAFLNLLNPFITIWLGKEYVFSSLIVMFIVLNFYIDGMRQSTLIFKDASGLFWNDRYKPIVESIVNLAVSIYLGYYYGVLGILLGTFVSMFFISSICEVYVLFKNNFNRNIYLYYKKYFYYFIQVLIAYLVLSLSSNFIYNGTIISFIFICILTVFIPNIVFLAFNYKNENFMYFYKIIKNKLNI